jgi:hypothetical protein
MWDEGTAYELVAYAAFLKIKFEQRQLTAWQSAYNLGTLYDELSNHLRNTRVSYRNPRDGILRLR